VVTAIVAGLVGLGGVFLGQRVSGAAAERQWHRDQRADAYADLLRVSGVTTAAFIRVNDSKSDAADYDQLKREADSRLFEFNAATARVRLLGGAECALAADRFYKHFEAEIVPKVSRDLRPDSDAYKELRSLAAALLQAARRDLGVPDHALGHAPGG
jgi:hypothetical protein